MQLRALSECYLRPLEPLVAEKAYTQLDLNGFKSDLTRVYAAACRKLVAVQSKITKLADAASVRLHSVRLVINLQTCERPHDDLTSAARRLWNSRMPLLQMFNRSRQLGVIVTTYQSRDPQFKRTMEMCYESAKQERVLNSFGVLISQLTLSSLTELKGNLDEVVKYTTDMNLARGALQDCSQLLGRLLMFVDSGYKHYSELRAFQDRLPLCEINFLSEHRRLLHQSTVLQKIKGKQACDHGHAIEVSQLQSRHMVLMSDCLIVCRIQRDENPNVSPAPWRTHTVSG